MKIEYTLTQLRKMTIEQILELFKDTDVFRWYIRNKVSDIVYPDGWNECIYYASTVKHNWFLWNGVDQLIRDACQQYVDEYRKDIINNNIDISEEEYQEDIENIYRTYTPTHLLAARDSIEQFKELLAPYDRDNDCSIVYRFKKIPNSDSYYNTVQGYRGVWHVKIELISEEDVIQYYVVNYRRQHPATNGRYTEEEIRTRCELKHGNGDKIARIVTRILNEY